MTNGLLTPFGSALAGYPAATNAEVTAFSNSAFLALASGAARPLDV